jgi:Transcriptional regulators
LTSLKEIAEKAKVSVSTVSRVLNYDDTLSVQKSTRQRVFQVAEELNYTKFVNKKSRETISIISWYSEAQEVQDAYYLSIRMGVEKQIIKSGYNVQRIFGDGDWNLARQSKAVVGIGKFSREQISELKSVSKELVIVGQDTLAFGINCVVTDIVVSIESVLQDFIEKNRTNIGIFTGPGRTTDDKEKLYDDRLKVFREYLRSKHLYKSQNTFIGPISPSGGYETAMKAVTEYKGDFPNAIFVCGDTMAVGILKCFKQKGISVPDEVSVVSFNDSPTAEFSNPTLSSIKVYTERMGEIGVTVLNQLFKEDMNGVPNKIVTGTSITYRESSI